MLNNKKGITLIALAITIVVLMILAGVSITMVTDDEGVVTKAKTAAQETELAGIKEDIQKEITRAIAAERGNLSDSELEEVLKNYGELNSDKTILTTNPSKTNTEYSYEIKLSDLYLGNTTEDDVTKYTVRFYNYDGTFLAQTRVNAGTVASYSGATPIKPESGTTTYTFANKWSTEKGGTEEADVSSVQKDMDVYAMFNESAVELVAPIFTLSIIEDDAYYTGGYLTVNVAVSNASEVTATYKLKYYIMITEGQDYLLDSLPDFAPALYGQYVCYNEGTTDTEYTFENLRASIEYKIKVEAVDDSGNVLNTATITSWTACFVAGTEVLTETGLKNIEDIKIGEMVYTINTDTNQRELKRVISKYVGETNEAYEITIGNEVIIATPKHEFYIVDKGWIRAYDLLVGDRVSSKLEDLTITKIEHKVYEETIPVYNLTVEGNHNYLITSTEILVHNAASVI